MLPRKKKPSSVAEEPKKESTPKTKTPKTTTTTTTKTTKTTKTPKTTTPKKPRASKKKVDTQIKRKIGGELKYEGLERKIYSWMKQRRNFCAIHKSLYYFYATPILEDMQYDYVEDMLKAVENKYPDIGKALSEDGWLSPQEYVDCLNDLLVSQNAKMIYDKWLIGGKKPLDIPFRTSEDTEEILYEIALKSINEYPI